MENGYMTYLITLFAKFKQWFGFKIIGGWLLSAVAFFFDPTQYLAHTALFSLILIDFVFGVVSARKQGEAIKSSKLVKTAVKFVIYFTLIAAARAMEHTIPVFPFFDETIVGFLAATEMLSILENTGRMGYAVPQKLVKILGDYTSNK